MHDIIQFWLLFLFMTIISHSKKVSNKYLKKWNGKKIVVGYCFEKKAIVNLILTVNFKICVLLLNIILIVQIFGSS